MKAYKLQYTSYDGFPLEAIGQTPEDCWSAAQEAGSRWKFQPEEIEVPDDFFFDEETGATFDCQETQLDKQEEPVYSLDEVVDMIWNEVEHNLNDIACGEAHEPRDVIKNKIKNLIKRWSEVC